MSEELRKTYKLGYYISISFFLKYILFRNIDTRNYTNKNRNLPPLYISDALQANA